MGGERGERKGDRRKGRRGNEGGRKRNGSGKVGPPGFKTD